MATNTMILNEDNNRKRGLRISIGLHILIILLALIPFLSNLQPDEPEQAKFVTIDFTDFKPASREGAKPQKVKTASKPKKQVKKSVPQAKPVPKPKPTPQTKPKPVLTAPTKETPIKTTPKKTEEVKDEAPLEKPTEDKTPEAPAEEEAAADRQTDDPDGAEAASDSEVDKATESGSGTGNKSDGKADDGINWGEVTGEGIFSRRVIYRADVRKITEEEGKIVIRLCINRDGRVVFAQNDDATTISDPAIVRKAIQLTTKYRFERDYTAPEKQCGKLTYIFTIDKE